MAYTYDDFVKARDAAGLNGRFSQGDLDLAHRYPEFGLSMVSLMRDTDGATTNEQRLLATEAMNQLRKNYGVYWTGTGGAYDRSYAGSYGSRIGDALDRVGGYEPYNSGYSEQIREALDGIGSFGDFRYGKENKYQDLLDRAANPEPFSYDPETDPAFASYKKIYNREGDRASANALAQTAAATGGVPSSYAGRAAQEAGAYYAAKLADALPTLRDKELGEYNSRYAQLLQGLGALESERKTQYQEYLDGISRAQARLQALQGQDATEYQRYLDGISQAQQALLNYQNQDKTDYERYLDMLSLRDKDLQTALQYYQLTGQITQPLEQYMLTTVSGMGSSEGGDGGGGEYYGGSSSAPAAWYSMSDAERKAWQAAIGASPDGVWGPETERLSQAAMDAEERTSSGTAHQPTGTFTR